MLSKFFEIRDSATYIPAIACRPSDLNLDMTGDLERDLAINHGVGRAGYRNSPIIILTRLDTTETHNETWSWSSKRTLSIAHQFIQENWDELKSGSVIDVQFILKEATEIKKTDGL